MTKLSKATMKKIVILTVLLFSNIIFAQKEPEPKHHELSSNLLDLVAAGSLNVTYERLIQNNQSFLVSATLFETFGYYDAGFIDKNNAFSIKAAYLLYFSKLKNHYGFFFYPQLKLRNGRITLDDYSYYGWYNDSVQVSESYTIDGFSAGFGLGHKWLFNDQFSLSIFGEVARDLANRDTPYIDSVEARFGINFGIRF
jgi:hypothetical protein